MSTAATPQPASASSVAVNTANSILNALMKELKPTTAAVVGTIMALNENSSPIQETADTITALTNAATMIPNPTVQTLAALAQGIEAVVASGVGIVEGANPPPPVVPNAHPGFKLWLLHPNEYRQEQKLAAAATPPTAPTPVPAAQPLSTAKP